MSEEQSPSSNSPQIPGGTPRSRRPTGRQAWKRNTKKQTPPPRFGIQHLLLWTACWGVYIALTRRYLGNDPGVSSLLSVALFGVGYSAALLGLAICVTRRICDETWPIEPGEWLLVVTGAIFILGELQTNMFPNAFTRPFLVLTAIRCVLLLVPILGKSMSSCWKYLFLLLLCIHTSVLINVLLGNWHHFTPLMRMVGTQVAVLDQGAVLDCILPITCAAIDYGNRKWYTWLHWLGIATGLWLAGCTTLALLG